MVKKIINYVIEAISAWLQETPEESVERRAKRQEKLSKANAGKKLLSLTGIFYFAELIALWAMSYCTYERVLRLTFPEDKTACSRMG